MVNAAQELSDIALKALPSFNVAEVIPALRAANEGAIDDVLNSNGCAYYQWSSCLIDYLKPKQVVELGGAMGVWDIFALHTLPKDSDLWSITIPEHGLEFSYVVDKYPNFHPIVGNDLDLSNWPKELNLHKTDLWFIDTIHTYEQVKAELETYSRFFKKGAVLLFDDIRMNEGMWRMWNELPYEKHENTNPCHYTGFGIAIV